MSRVASDQVLDATGLRCPLPVLKARRALAALAPGRVLEVLANDPASAEDFSALCRLTGHRMVAQSLEDGVHRFLIQAAEPRAV